MIVKTRGFRVQHLGTWHQAAKHQFSAKITTLVLSLRLLFSPFSFCVWKHSKHTKIHVYR